MRESDRTYDVFAKLQTGEPLWQCSAEGIADAVDTVQKLAQVTTFEIYAMYLPTHEIVVRANATNQAAA